LTLADVLPYGLYACLTQLTNQTFINH
jgi:hypothetical protein